MASSLRIYVLVFFRKFWELPYETTELRVPPTRGNGGIAIELLEVFSVLVFLNDVASFFGVSSNFVF
jgi:hypothetical protein